MRKSNYGKKHLFSKRNNKDKEKLALFIYLPIAAISLMICAVILLMPQKTQVVNTPFNTVPEETEKSTYSPMSPSSIKFQSLGNKTCAI